jgi:ribonuclease Z
MGTAACIDHLVKAAEWHNQSKIGIGPSGGRFVETHEFDVSVFSEENPQVTVYEENGVTINAFPVIHCIYGAVGYRLEWNGLSLSFHGDGSPTSFEAEQAKGVDVFMHEGFLDPETWSEKTGMPLEVTTNIVGEHTTGEKFGKLCEIVEPALAVAYHYFTDDDTVDPWFNRLRSTWDGPAVLAQDLTVINITLEQIVTRQAETSQLYWPPPAPKDKMPELVMEDHSDADVPEWLVNKMLTEAAR